MIKNKTIYKSKATRLSELMLKDISLGQFAVEEPLPSENELAENYSVSRSTIRKVISMLTDDGTLVKEPNRRVWINEVLSSQRVCNDSVAEKNNLKKEYSIAVVWSAYPDALTVEISEGIKKYCLEHPEVKFQLMTSNTDHSQTIKVLTHAREYGIDGVIVLPYEDEEYRNALKKLIDDDFKVVCVDRELYGIELNTVKVDNSYGMYSAATSLILKYRKPVYFLGPKIIAQPQKERYDGYCRAMLDAGFEAAIKENSYFYESRDSDPEYWQLSRKWMLAYKIALEMFKKVEFPCSIVCLHDYAARGVYEAAEELGLKIGEDIRIIGFDDLPMARCMSPSLSSVLQPRRRIGYDAANILHKMLTGRIVNKINISLPVRLIERGSS